MDLSKNYYVLDSDEDFEKNKNNNSIELSTVSPTEAAVEQAKSEIREEMNINTGKNRKNFQIGGKDRSNSNSKRSPKKKKNNVVKKNTRDKKKEVKGKSSKKGDKKSKKKGYQLQVHMDVVQTSLSLFAPPATDKSIVKEYWDYNPIAAITEGGVLEFNVPGTRYLCRLFIFHLYHR